MKLLLLLTLLSDPLLKDYNATLIECYDGDTCTFNIHFGLGVVLAKQTVRFCDINAPEIRPLKTRQEATKVRDNVVYLIRSARKVQLRIPQKRNCDDPDTCDDKGKYGRWLAYIIIDGNNLNQMLLDNGLVDEWKDKCI